MISRLRFLLALCAIGVFTCCEETQSVVPNTGDQAPPASEAGDPNEIKKIRLLTADNNGRLIIDGNAESYSCDTTLAIKGGQYSSIVVRNLSGKAGCPIRIQNEGLVEIVGYRKTLAIANVSHVVISGDGTDNIDKGFLFRDNDYRAVEISGDIDYFTLQHAEFRNVKNYVISYNSGKIFDGSENSYSRELKFNHLSADNCGPFINFEGGISEGEIKGLVRGLEISYVDVTNSPWPRNVIYFGMVENYDIHHNVFSNINTKNDNHNAMCQLTGNGKFYNNHISNHQGNAIRAWVVSIGTSPKEVHIFNNIVVNSRKYSAFETQSFERFIIPQKTTYANVKVYHNTCGHLNLSEDWYGVVLDAYRLLGGTCEVYNNLAFSLPAPHPKSPIVSYMSIETSNLRESGNQYFPDAKAAGIIDEKSFKITTTSGVSGGGVKSGLGVDFYGNSRNLNTPTIGAVE